MLFWQDLLITTSIAFKMRFMKSSQLKLKVICRQWQTAIKRISVVANITATTSNQKLWTVSSEVKRNADIWYSIQKDCSTIFIMVLHSYLYTLLTKKVYHYTTSFLLLLSALSGFAWASLTVFVGRWKLIASIVQCKRCIKGRLKRFFHSKKLNLTLIIDGLFQLFKKLIEWIPDEKKFQISHWHCEKCSSWKHVMTQQNFVLQVRIISFLDSQSIDLSNITYPFDSVWIIDNMNFASSDISI